MKSNCTSMKEMQQLMAALREVYTDVRLLDAETLQQIQEGARTDPHGPEFCYACRHKDRFSRCCAARQATWPLAPPPMSSGAASGRLTPSSAMAAINSC